MPTLNAFDNGDVRATTIVFHPHRSDGARIQNKTINTLTAFMGTGGLNTPMVAHPISGNMIGRQEHNRPNGWTVGTEEDPMFTLTSTDRHAIAFSHTQGLDAQPSEDVTPILRKNGGGMAAEINMQVRRLTPVECERLQGFPDGWTEGQADTHRYKQMGNAVAVPVVEWILDGIVDAFNQA